MPRVNLPTHEDNGQVVDYLEEDAEHPTQRYAVMSFLSPEKVLKDKQQFMFEKFVEWMDYEWKIRGLENFMAFVSKKYSLKIDDLLADANEFTKVRKEEVKKTDIQEQFQTFLLKNEKELQEMYDHEVNFRTNVRGVKIRRVFPTVEEAQNFAKFLQHRSPKDNVYVGKVGLWLPWDPSEHLMPEVQYAEKELNELMRKYKENESNKEIFFAEQREESMKAQKEENEKRRKANAEQKALDDASKPVHPSEGILRE